MALPDSRASAPRIPWTSLWIVALISLLAQLWLCQFFSFGERVPVSLDIDPSNLWKQAYDFPPIATFRVLNWLGVAYFAPALQPLSLAANLPPWWFFTCYAPVIGTLSLLAMAAFLREMELPRPAALFGGVIYVWQGDFLPFVYPGHYAYMATWPFFAVAAWGALRSERTRHWAYALISGVSCGLMVSLQPDRGAIASILIGILYIATFFRHADTRRTVPGHFRALTPLLLCVVVAFLVALAPLLALFQSNISGVKIGGTGDREQTYKLITQFSLHPLESLTYLVPGLFGWHMNSADGPYWGWIGEWPDWPQHHQGSRNLNLAISTTGTVATVLALIGAILLVFEKLLGPVSVTGRQRYYGRILLATGFVALVLSWGWHTPFYRPLFALPLMDKWRNPLKWLEWTNFALVVLSAIGVQHAITSLEAPAPDARIIRHRLAWLTYGLTLLLGLGLLVSYLLSPILAAALQVDTYEPSAISSIIGTMHTSLVASLVSMIIFCFILRILWNPETMRGWTIPNPLLHRVWQRMLTPECLPLTLAVAAAVLCAVQLGWVANQFIQPVPLEELTASNPLLEALRSEGDTVRVSADVGDPLLEELVQNQFAAMDISCLDISAASRIPDDFNAFMQTLQGDQARLWLLTGVKNIVIPESGLAQMRQDPSAASDIDHADGYTLEPTPSPNMPSHVIVGLKDYLAKATLVPDAEVISGDNATLARLKDPAWNPRASVLVDSASDLTVPAATGPPASTNALVLESYTPTQIKVEAKTTRPGFVLINDQYNSDWRTRVNGHDVPLLRADYILRAVAIPAGLSEITLDYIAHYHLAGLALNAELINLLSDTIMLAAWIIAAFALRRRP
jgi:hypothetical protein